MKYSDIPHTRQYCKHAQYLHTGSDRKGGIELQCTKCSQNTKCKDCIFFEVGEYMQKYLDGELHSDLRGIFGSIVVARINKERIAKVMTKAERERLRRYEQHEAKMRQFISVPEMIRQADVYIAKHARQSAY